MTDISEDELNAIAEEALQSESSAFEEVSTPEPKRKAFSIKTFIRQSELQEDLKFSEHNIDDAMMNQASLYSHYATQGAKAQLQADRCKSQLELIEALIDKELRDEAAENGTKITEAALTKAVKLDSRYQKAVANVSESKMIASMTKSTTEAFGQRRDMLVQIGKDLREERLGELRIRANTERMGDLKETALLKMKGQ